MSKYFNSWATDDEILHYGVKGMKWRKRTGGTRSTTYPNRPRARQRFITEGNGRGVDRMDEKVGGYHNTKPHDQATSGLSVNDRLSILQRNAKLKAKNKDKKQRRKQAFARIKAALA